MYDFPGVPSVSGKNSLIQACASYRGGFSTYITETPRDDDVHTAYAWDMEVRSAFRWKITAVESAGSGKPFERPVITILLMDANGKITQSYDFVDTAPPSRPIVHPVL